MIYIFVAIFGLIIGSFLSVVVNRLPIMLKIQWEKECHDFLGHPITETHEPFNLFLPRSHCPQCKKKIVWWQNIPLLSFILLKGRCVHCHCRIPFLYPLLELFCAILSVWVIWHFGLNAKGIMALIFTYGLIALSVIDWKTQLLPDEITLPFLWLGLLLSLFYVFTSPEQAILGAIFGYGILWIIKTLYRLVRRKEGMGHGDLKLLALLGAWTGPFSVIHILIFASFMGLSIAIISLALKKTTFQTPLPFGPYLAIAGWLTFLYGPFLLRWIGV